MELPIQLVIKVQQFEDKRIEAKASWNIKELKGKLSEIYPTSTEEQKLIYSGKLLNDSVVLKDILREYEGQEAHTVHLVFTPKSGSHSTRQSSKITTNTSQSTTPNTMSPNELRQRHPSVVSGASAIVNQEQSNVMNIPSNYASAFYGGNGDPSNIIAQQYAMQSWMQQAYQQYMQRMTLLQSPEAFYQMNQQQQPQQPQHFAFIPPQMPFAESPVASATIANDASTPQSPNDAQAAPVQQPPVADPQAQPRFPNIIQDEQENRDWLDILYSMSRLMILLCLVYFYSSPVRCLVVILIGISIYLYHIYKQNQSRLNNNNSTRVNLNVRPEAIQQPAQPPVVDDNVNNEQREVAGGESQQPHASTEAEPLVTPPEPTMPEEPQVPLLTVVRTFVLSFFSSIIPEAPAL